MTAGEVPVPPAAVGIVMGSDSDWPVMEQAAIAVAEFDVPYEVDVVSAHRHAAGDAGLRGAGDRSGPTRDHRRGRRRGPPAGHACQRHPLPVIGVPVPLAHLNGLDSLLSIVQMPAGVPVATVSIGGARNAGLLAVRILAASDAALRQRMDDFRRSLNAAARAKGEPPP